MPLGIPCDEFKPHEVSFQNALAGWAEQMSVANES